MLEFCKGPVPVNICYRTEKYLSAADGKWHLVPTVWHVVAAGMGAHYKTDDPEKYNAMVLMYRHFEEGAS